MVVEEKNKLLYYRFSEKTEDCYLEMGSFDRKEVESYPDLEKAYESQIEEGEVVLSNDPYQIYSFLMDTLGAQGSIAVQDDFWIWWKNGMSPKHGKVFYVDPDDVSVHQIFFDDNARPELSNVSCIDLHNGDFVSEKRSRDKFIVAVDPLRAIIEQDYFLKKIEECEFNRKEELRRREEGINTDDELEETEVSVSEWEKLQSLPNDEYLIKTVGPILHQGLQMVALMRPKEPLKQLATYLLMNQHLVNMPKP